MVKVIMNFEVEDWDKWHAAFLANSKMREENDIKEIYVGHELENKNKVHVIYDTPAPDTIQKMMQKPEVQEVMKNAGNKVETMVVATFYSHEETIIGNSIVPIILGNSFF